MKFTCDDCGAQYMIADEKIGQRGVKVRCKKCANVIILRPDKHGPGANGAGVKASAPPGGNGQKAAAKKPAPSTGAPPPPPPADEHDDPDATMAADSPRMYDDAARPSFSALPSELIGETSSELGLSVEFAAAGFEETRQVKGNRPVTLNLGLDVDRLGQGREEPSGPFSNAAVGGSLDDMRSERQNGHVGGVRSSPMPPSSRIENDDDEDPAASTRVDQQALREDDETDERHKVGSEEFSEPKTTVGFAVPRRDDDEDQDDEGDVAAALGKELDAQLGGSAANGRAALGGRAAMANPDHVDQKTTASPLSAALAAQTRDDDGNTDGEGTRGEPTDDGGLSSDERDAGLSVAPTREGVRPRSGSRVTAIGAGSIAGSGLGAPHLDEEIGSAFDAVFGGEGTEGGDSLHALARDADRALDDEAPSGGAPPDKIPTKVFDSEAMQRLQDEQDRAASPPPPVKEPTQAKREPREWYLAIDDEQVGPMSVTDVQSRWDGREVNGDSLCWKQGMADWIPIKTVKELSSTLGDGERVSTMVSKVVEPAPERRAATERGKSVMEEAPRERAASVVAGRGAMARTETEVPAAEKRDPLAGVPAAPSAAGEPEEPSEPSWRPSAASALASLAAAELSGEPEKSDKKPAKSKDAGVPGALEEDKVAHMFGAAEMSASRIRPLPKAPDLMSSAPLRDPDRRGKSSNMLPLILGIAALVGVVVIGAVVLTRQPAPAPAPAAPPQQPIAMNTPPPAKPAPATVPGQPAPAEVAPGAAPAAGAAAAAGAPPAAEGTATPPPSMVPAPGQPAPPPAVPAAAPAPAAAPEPARKPGALAGKAKRPTGDREAKPGRRAEVAEAQPEAAPAPPPPPPAPKPASALSEDDLIPGGKKKAAESDLPAQLDESEILRVLRKNKAAIKACVEKQAKEDPNLEGAMKVSMVIQNNGKTTRHAVEPEKFNGTLAAKCVLAEVKAWTFPQFSGPPMPIDFPVRLGQ